MLGKETFNLFSLTKVEVRNQTFSYKLNTKDMHVHYVSIFFFLTSITCLYIHGHFYIVASIKVSIAYSILRKHIRYVQTRQTNYRKGRRRRSMTETGDLTSVPTSVIRPIPFLVIFKDLT